MRMGMGVQARGQHEAWKGATGLVVADEACDHRVDPWASFPYPIALSRLLALALALWSQEEAGKVVELARL
jgi:hypothetical protein